MGYTEKEQKWCQISTTSKLVKADPKEGSSKRRKCDDGAAQSSASHSVNNVEDSDEVRPPGVKAGKAQLKRSHSKTATVEEEARKMQNIQNVWELKQRDIAQKKELSEKIMLESLLLRTEPLSELELALKNQLITDMLARRT